MINFSSGATLKTGQPSRPAPAGRCILYGAIRDQYIAKNVTASADATVQVLVVHVATVRCGFVLDDVVEVLPAVETAALPGAPEVIGGVIDLRGALVPVLDLRRRLGLPGRSPHVDDHVVVCHVGARSVAIWVDRAADVLAIARRDLAPLDDVAQAGYLPGVTRRDDGLMLVYDVRSFLAADEALRLDTALSSAQRSRP
jgi:purine-binding chemotaxis protein CheW